MWAYSCLLYTSCAHGIQIVPAHLLDGGDVPVADKFSILVVVSRRKRHDLLTEPHQVFGLTGKDDGPGGVVTVVERTDTDGDVYKRQARLL